MNVLNITNNTILTTPGLDSGFAAPDFIAITPDGQYAYVTNLFSAGVTVIDTASNTIVSTPGLDSGFFFPQSITITPNGAYAYVTNGLSSNSVVVIDIATNTIIPTPGLTGVFSSPVSIAFTPDGSYGYVANSGNNTVSIIDTASNTVIYTITGFDNPQTIAITPDGQYAYVVNAGNNTVSVLFIGVHLPTSFTGCKRKNIFLTQVDNYNDLTWSAPSGGNSIASYVIYRDSALTQLVATIPASSVLEYYDHNRNPKIDYTYYLIAVDTLGNISAPMVTTVTQHCCRL